MVSRTHLAPVLVLDQISSKASEPTLVEPQYTSKLETKDVLIQIRDVILKFLT